MLTWLVAIVSAAITFNVEAYKPYNWRPVAPTPGDDFHNPLFPKSDDPGYFNGVADPPIELFASTKINPERISRRLVVVWLGEGDPLALRQWNCGSHTAVRVTFGDWIKSMDIEYTVGYGLYVAMKYLKTFLAYEDLASLLGISPLETQWVFSTLPGDTVPPNFYDAKADSQYAELEIIPAGPLTTENLHLNVPNPPSETITIAHFRALWATMNARVLSAYAPWAPPYDADNFLLYSCPPIWMLNAGCYFDDEFLDTPDKCEGETIYINDDSDARMFIVAAASAGLAALLTALFFAIARAPRRDRRTIAPSHICTYQSQTSREALVDLDVDRDPSWA